MVNHKNTKRKRDIKTKLMAAICMLMVSVIMMVSTTYAWFTLSTAPEVTGINTAVGANGNLEMALLPATGDVNLITSQSGDSVKAVTERNITWGNLVDVSDASYGLEKITLYPSALNIDNSGKLPVSGAMLKTPAYGADGRVSELLANTLTGIYNTANSSFSPDASYGVRAVGTASGMTDRQLSYRNARAAANSAVSLATKAASDSLSNNGGALANVAIKKGTKGNDATFTQADLTALETIISDLETKVLPQIETAYMQYILAYAASAQTGDSDAAWSAVKNLVEAKDATLATVRAGLTTAGISVAGTPLETAMVDYDDIVTAVADARTKLNTANKKTDDAIYTWAEMSPILTALADPDAMQVNGIAAGQIMQGDNMNKLFNSVAGGNGLVVTMASGGGVYADIADQCGDFTAGVKIDKVEYGGLEVGPLDAKMNTKSGVTPCYLSRVGSAVEMAGAPASGAVGAVPITDMFGYIIDMAFRTNAADSNLLLQQTAADRIYSSNQTGAEIKNEDGSVETTMGGGAYMEFTSTTNSFGNDKVLNLMEAIRIVFFDPDSGEIIVKAKLDTTNYETTADGGIRAKIVLYTETEGVSYVEAAEGGTHYKVETTTYEAVTEGATHIADAAATGGYRPVTGDEVATHKAVTTVEYKLADADHPATHKQIASGAHVIKNDNVIMALNQNTAVKLSVLVYLDGDSVTNADVAATANTSVTGTMNLQFASSANLVPMDYTPLMVGGTAAPEETPAG